MVRSLEARQMYARKLMDTLYHGSQVVRVNPTWDKSLSKWNDRDLYDQLVVIHQKTGWSRLDTWLHVICRACSYCEVYKVCDACPLGRSLEGRICRERPVKDIKGNLSLFWMMEKAFNQRQKARFIRYQQRLIKGLEETREEFEADYSGKMNRRKEHGE